jgi:hypothetical protein
MPRLEPIITERIDKRVTQGCAVHIDELEAGAYTK